MNLSNWRVLVADDDYDSREIMEQLFELHQIPFQVVSDGQACLEAIANFQPTIVIADLAMPELDGWQVFQAIRAKSEWDEIQVVAITAYHSVKVMQDVQQMGFSAYFTKPINSGAFIEELYRILS